MKKFLQLITVTTLFLSFSNQSYAQYCMPPGFIDGPWTNMTNVSLETLNNSSVYPTGAGADTGYVYYSAVAVPSLMQGQAYPITVTADDGSIMGMEIRVWIDWNQDYTFNPTSELVATWTTANSGTIVHSGTVNVPAGANVGTTRMRVYCDMPVAGGHIATNPCGYLGSANVIGQHGETEDYDVTVIASAGVNELNSAAIALYPNPTNGIVHVSSNQGINSISVYSATGTLVQVIEGNSTVIDMTGQMEGIYFVTISTDESTVTERIVVR